MERHPELHLSVSVTTRAPRPDERDGIDYRFVSGEEFDRLVAGGELLEWAPVVGHRSGTPARPVEEALAAGRDVVLEIDVQGARQVRVTAEELLATGPLARFEPANVLVHGVQEPRVVRDLHGG